MGPDLAVTVGPANGVPQAMRLKSIHLQMRIALICPLFTKFDSIRRTLLTHYAVPKSVATASRFLALRSSGASTSSFH